MEILYQNPAFVVCCKDAGMESEQALPQAVCAQLGGVCFPVHRLDRNTAGLMVLARTGEAAAALSRIIQAGGMTKEYQALVHGTVPEAGIWEDLLWKDARKNKVYVVQRRRGGVREARLGFVRLSWGAGASLVQIRLDTGRSHQIRVQFASRGYPLVGDGKYGARDNVPALHLHSCRLVFSYGGQAYSFAHFPPWGRETGPDIWEALP